MSSSDADKGARAAPRPLLVATQPLASLKEYHAAIDGLIASALGRIRIFDRRLGSEYNSAARIDAMRAFLLANRANKISIVLHEVDRIRLDCPRLVTLQRQFASALGIHRTLSIARGVYDPFCVADGSHYARRFHFDTLRGMLAHNDAENAAELVRRFDEIWEVSQPAVMATTLGL